MDRRQLLAGIGATALIPATAKAFQQAPSFSFPPEWEEHEAIWMGWQDSVTNDDGRRTLWLEMIKALEPHVHVKLVVGSGNVARYVRTLLSEAGVTEGAVTFVVQKTTDVWLRDAGPLFISNGQSLQLADFAWNFYGFPWPISDPIGMARGSFDQEVAAQFGFYKRTSPIVAEGGGLDVNSDTVVAYKDALMHRNPQHSVATVENEIKRLYGKKQLIWLDRAPISDRVFAGPKVANYFGWGANGHVDEYVRFVSEDTILVAQVSEEERDLNPLYRLDHEILAENMQQLKAARTPEGKRYKVIPVPMPDVTALMATRTLAAEDFEISEDGTDMRSLYRDFSVGDEVHFLPAASYLNFLVTNGVVLVARYGTEGRSAHLGDTDEAMRKILAEQYPDREIIQIDPLAINWGGGGMHCITQQEPKLKS